jgi:hypothetical protein
LGQTPLHLAGLYSTDEMEVAAVGTPTNKHVTTLEDLLQKQANVEAQDEVWRGGVIFLLFKSSCLHVLCIISIGTCLCQCAMCYVCVLYLFECVCVFFGHQIFSFSRS